MVALWRVALDDEVRWAEGAIENGPAVVLPAGWSLRALLTAAGEAAIAAPAEPLASRTRVLVPLDSQEVWASGVTFLESRYAREVESGVRSRDVYRDVYQADRPELFFKAAAGTAVGPGDAIGIRADSDWNVPEPELGLLVSADAKVVAYTLGNDVSSRSIEGSNPLYLPQAKVYDGSCAIGPCLVPVEDAPPLADLKLTATVERDGKAVWRATSSLSDLRRTPAELVDWLFRARSFPDGVVLLTGTGIVPPDDFTLAAGDQVTISSPALGMLTNTTRVVGIAASPAGTVTAS